MVIKDCRECKHCERRVWSHRYYPSSGMHAIGMSHAYRFCLKHGRNCADVKGCKDKEVQ